MLQGAAAWGKEATILASLFSIIFEASSHINKNELRMSENPEVVLHCFPFSVPFASGPENSCGKLIKTDHQLNRITVARNEPFPAGEVRK